MLCITVASRQLATIVYGRKTDGGPKGVQVVLACLVGVNLLHLGSAPATRTSVLMGLMEPGRHPDRQDAPLAGRKKAE